MCGRPGKRVPASPPALVSKVVYSFLLFSIPNPPRWSAEVYFSPHELSQARHRGDFSGRNPIPPKRPNISDPRTPRAREPLDDPAAPCMGGFSSQAFPSARPSSSEGTRQFPPFFVIALFIYFYLEEQRKVARHYLSRLEWGRIVQALK